MKKVSNTESELKKAMLVIIHGSSPPNFRGGWGLKISDQNNWGGPEQKNKFGGGS